MTFVFSHILKVRKHEIHKVSATCFIGKQQSQDTNRGCRTTVCVLHDDTMVFTLLQRTPVGVCIEVSSSLLQEKASSNVQPNGRVTYIWKGMSLGPTRVCSHVSCGWVCSWPYRKVPRGLSDVLNIGLSICDPRITPSASSGSLLECRVSGPPPGLLNQNLHFSKIPGWVLCTLKYKKWI